jgi:hypothetical protein
VLILPSEKRKEFEKLMKELDYRDRLPVYPKEEKKYQQVNFKCSDGAMAIYTYIIPYQTKKSYLYLEFIDNYKSPDIKQKIKTLAKRIHFHEKTRLMEVGWEVKYTKQPDQFSLEERKKVFYEFIKYTYDHLQKGMIGFYPQPGDVLAAKPHGPKINEGFNEESLTVGRRQRALVARKFGFGELYDDGFQYARYDDDCILRPI